MPEVNETQHEAAVRKAVQRLVKGILTADMTHHTKVGDDDTWASRALVRAMAETAADLALARVVTERHIYPGSDNEHELALDVINMIMGDVTTALNRILTGEISAMAIGEDDIELAGMKTGEARH